MPKKIFDLSGIITIDGLQGAVKGLKDLGTQFEQTEKAFYKFGRQIGSAGSKLTSSITLPVIAVAGAVTLAAKSFGEYSKEIYNLQSLTGLSTDSLQELKVVSSDAGANFESFVSAIKMFTKNMPQMLSGSGDASATLRKLGISVFDSNGHFRNMNILFPEIIKKLQNVTNETDRTALAQTLFGKGVAEITPVLGMTNDEFDAAIKKSHDLGLVMSGEGLKSAKDFRIALEDATSQLVAMGRSAMLDLLPIFKDTIFPLFRDSIIPTLRGAAEKAADLAKWFNGLDSNLKKNILTFIGISAAVGPALIVFGKLSAGIAGVSAAIKILKTAMVTFAAFSATNPLALSIIAVGMLVGVWVAARVAFQEYNEVANKLNRIEGLRTGIEGLNQSIQRIRLNAVSLEDAKNKFSELGKATKDLVGLAEELGFVFDDSNGSELDQLRTIGELITKTNSLSRATKEFNNLKPKTKLDSGGVPIVDLAVDKKIADEREKINRETEDQIAKYTLDKYAQLDRRKEKEIEEAKKVGANVLEIEKKFEYERQQMMIDDIKEVEAGYNSANDAREKREDDWTQKVLDQSDDKIKILENKRAREIDIAIKQGDSIENINKYYDAERKKAEKELAKETSEIFMAKIQNYMNVVGNIGFGIASLFQQSTVNKQVALDNQQQAERDAIENSLMSEKEKRAALDVLDKKQEKQRREFQRKAAKESKEISIFESIMQTATAVMAALGATPWGPWNFVYSGIVGAIGAAKTALIAAQPLPLAAGAIVRKRQGGVMAQIAEGGEDEAVIPLKTGVRSIAENLMSIMRESFSPVAPASLAMAGGGSMPVQENHWHIGVLVADDQGIKELERRQSKFRVSEAQRKGQAG